MSRKEADKKYDASEKGKARKWRYNRSEAKKANSRRNKDKRAAEGMCRACGRPLVDDMCPICSEGGTIRKQIWRELRRGIDT